MNLESLGPSATTRYTPEMRYGEWVAIEAFVLEVVGEVEPRVPYPRAALLNAISHHSRWVHIANGLPLDRSVVFRRDVIAAAVGQMPTTSPSTRGRRRSLLLRVGEQLGAIDRLPKLRPLSAASPSTPYSPSDQATIREWARLQGDTETRVSALALVSLGFGAGLSTRDLSAVRGSDVTNDACIVHVDGPKRRSVPIGAPWASILSTQVLPHRDRPTTLFRPSVIFHPNTVSTFISRADGGVALTPQRMRATWLVEQLVVGVPMHELLASAGLKSMDALVRYEKFLPPPSPNTRIDQLNREGNSPP